jgi:hypothetical protein
MQGQNEKNVIPPIEHPFAQIRTYHSGYQEKLKEIRALNKESFKSEKNK